jgi:hypothetical protein
VVNSPLGERLVGAIRPGGVRSSDNHQAKVARMRPNTIVEHPESIGERPGVAPLGDVRFRGARRKQDA